MGDLVLKGATSGQITITPTGVAGTNTLTLPAKTGNIITSADSGTVTQAMFASNVAGNGPAFFAYSNSAQNVSNGVDTKTALNTKVFDTASCFDAVTNYRFTPTVAGYYQVSASIALSAGSWTSGYSNAMIFKNGSVYVTSGTHPNNANYAMANVSAVIYMNGSTDYIEFYSNHSGAATNPGSIVAGLQWTYMSGALVRSA